MEVVQLQLGRTPSGEITGIVRFQGQATISGSTIPHFDSEVDALCFEIGAESAEKLPRFENDQRRPWLCFENDGEIRKLLGQPAERRRVTIVIDDYQTVHQYTDTFDTARFIRIIK